MCGIVGYIGVKEKDFLLSGLKELEYRGYDSAGIAVLKNNEITSYKATGKLENLISKTQDFSSEEFGLGIGHTRWATHGKPTEMNAHPHWGEYSYVVHNGIIENYREIKDNLEADGVKFLSQTDTEVVVHHFEKLVNEGLDTHQAFINTIQILEGAYAILLISKKEPDTIFFAKNAVPLIVGQNNEGEKFLGSADSPLIGYANEVIYLEDGEYGWIDKKSLKLFKNNQEVTPIYKPLREDKISAQKEGYRFFYGKRDL